MHIRHQIFRDQLMPDRVNLSPRKPNAVNQFKKNKKINVKFITALKQTPIKERIFRNRFYPKKQNDVVLGNLRIPTTLCVETENPQVGNNKLAKSS